MSRADYHVDAVLPGRYNDYIDLWKKGAKMNSRGEELHLAMLAITEIVSAANKSEAERLVQKKCPKHTIDTAATKKLG
jgi:hypothetical protein